MNPAQQEEHPTLQQLAAYALGKLKDEETQQIEEHLLQCDDCARMAKDLPDDSLIGLLRAEDEPALDETFCLESSHHEKSIALAPGEQATHSPAASDTAVRTNLPTEHREARLDLPPELAGYSRYEILARLGKGGMGDVYKAQHRIMNRLVALKIIKPELMNHKGAAERFHREIQAASRLSHPNIVTAFDADHAGNSHFFVMEYVDGVDLDKIVRERGSLPVDEACDYIRQAALGLQHAHEQGMVHRDIKPHNLMVTGDQRAEDRDQESEQSAIVKILDFGLANFAADEAVEEAIEEDSRSGVSAPQLTIAGTMMGTPDYMAPEQADDAHSADIRADIYSLGCTLYCLLTGKAPFSEGSVMDKVKAHTEEAASPLSEFRDDVPPEVEAVLLKMMAKNPAERYQTPADVASALEEVIESIVDRKLRERGGGEGDGRTIHLAGGGSRRRWLAIALILLVSLGVGSFIFRNQIASLWQGETGELTVYNTIGTDVTVFDNQGNRFEDDDSDDPATHFTLKPGEYWIKVTESDKEEVILWRRIGIVAGARTLDIPKRIPRPTAPVNVTVTELTADGMTVEICNGTSDVVDVVEGDSRIYDENYERRYWPFRFDLRRDGQDGLKPGDCRKRTLPRYSEIPPFVTTVNFDVVSIGFSDGRKWSASEANAAPKNEVVFSFSENEDGPGTIGRFQGEVVNDPDAVLERLKKLAAENPDLVVRIEGEVDVEGPDFLEKFENAIRAAGVRFIKLPPEIEEQRRAAAESTFALEKTRSERRNNLVRIGIALHDYLSAAGEFPPSASVVPPPPPPRETSNGGGKGPALPENVKAPEKTKPRTDAGHPEPSPDAFFDENGRPHLSWRVHLLPFFRQKELTELYKKFHLDEPWDSEHNKALLDQMPDVYKTTDDPTKTTLLAVVGEGTAYEGKAGANRESFQDGFLNTAYVVDAGRERAVPWTKPEDLPFDPQDPIRAFGTSDFGDVFLALLADGAVGSIPYDTAPESLRALFTRAAGDTFDKNAKRTTPLPQRVSSPETQGEANRTQLRSPPDMRIAALLAEARLILTFDEKHFLEQDSTNLVRDMSWHRVRTVASGAVYTPDGVSGALARIKKGADGLRIENGLIASGNPYTVAGWIWLNWTRDDENPKAEVFSNRKQDDSRGFTASVARVGEYFKIGQDVPAQGDQPGQESISGSWGPFGFDDERPNLNFAQGRWGFVAFRRGTDGRLGYTVDGKSNWTPAKPMGHRSVPDEAFIGRGMDGRVDEFVVFDRALSDEEVELLYRHGRAGRGLAEADQVDLSTRKKPAEQQPTANQPPSVEAMIEEAASIPLDEWKKLATSENPLPSLITGSPLSLVLTLLNPPEAAKENSKVLEDFRYLKPGIPQATEIAQAMSHSSERGYVSMLQRAYILKVNTTSRQPKTADETGASVVQGTIDFEAPQLYAGRIHFTAEVEGQTARVTEFRLPNYDITIRRNENGAWQRVQPEK